MLNQVGGDHQQRADAFLCIYRVTLSMTLVIQLFGEGVGSILPLDVLVDCPGEGMSEVVSLRRKSNTQAVLFCHEPLLSKIKGFSHHHRKWKRGEDSRLQDGTSRPTVILELGIKKEGSRSAFMGVFLNQV